mmetsp:Transcript_4785/g.5533  ORF Transcript_4785/g.5533 Transcript_4785/m.5533 type:complete len:452 (+) Transcript_4785:104-1459(+)
MKVEPFICSTFLVLSFTTLAYVFEISKKRRRRKQKAEQSILKVCSLKQRDIERYGRQIVLPGFGVPGQKQLKESSILVVGAGGLGSTILPLLAGSGIKKIGIVDADIVDISNIHRQVIHYTRDQGRRKVESAREKLKLLNPSLIVECYVEMLNISNVEKIMRPYDVIIDATDNLEARYLINDSCYLMKKPLISGAAQGMEGQISVYVGDESGCYRCSFPKPPPQSQRMNCTDDGVLGPLPAIIGGLQALEAIKICSSTFESLKDHLVQFDGTDSSLVRLRRSKRSTCELCGINPSIKNLNDTENWLRHNHLLHQSLSCTTNLINSPQQLFKEISSVEYHTKFVQAKIDHLLIDVREAVQVEICSLKGSINLPLKHLRKKIVTVREHALQTHADRSQQWNDFKPIVVYCRRGIDSISAASILTEEFGFSSVYHLRGGLTEWARLVEGRKPVY